ncbi:MAG TPA: trehalose-phosphatase [Burkholderiales bacterium]|nr:trehalose-phosphatase [Burkholderiales bacterium]
MEILTPSLDLAAFLERIPAAPHRVLLLDYDGTLAPFQQRPELAVPYPEVLSVLNDIVRAGGTRIVIVSGRRAEELPPLLKLETRPEIWGSHGWERLHPDGTLTVEQPAERERAGLEQAAALLRPLLDTGARIERKPASVALHWRGLPAPAVASLRAATAERWKPLANDTELEVLPFDGGLELRAPGWNKQHAVKAVLAKTQEGSAIAYLGDDITDEDAFAAVKPRGIAVLVRPQFRKTCADVWIRPPRELLAFMKHWRVPARPG